MKFFMKLNSFILIVHFIPNIYCPNKARTRKTFMAIKKCKDTFFQLRFDIFAYVMYLEHIFSIEIEYGNMHNYFDEPVNYKKLIIHILSSRNTR